MREKEQKEKQSEKRTPRIKELDSFKGFLIFIVVFGHFLLPLKESPYPLFSRSFYLIYSFHMPAFVFLSGYFGYSGWKKRGTNFRSLLSYVFLYLFMQGMLHICDIFFYGSTRIFPDFWHASSTPWYILALIFWNLAMLPAEEGGKGNYRLSPLPDPAFRPAFLPGGRENTEGLPRLGQNAQLRSILLFGIFSKVLWFFFSKNL